MSFSGYMINQTLAHPHYEILLSNKKQQNIYIHNSLDGSQEKYVE